MSSAGRAWLAISLIVLACVSLTGVIYWRLSTYERPDIALPAPTSVHLPSVCAQYYNDGTDDWIECMGVGKK